LDSEFHPAPNSTQLLRLSALETLTFIASRNNLRSLY
jgi:hypothetical protein